MHPLIPYIIALFVLIWFSHALTKVFQREVDPIRRRDLTMANAEDPDAVQGRIFEACKPVNFAILATFGVEFLLTIWLVLEERAGPLQDAIPDAILMTLVFIMLIPICFACIAMLATRACRANRPLSSGAMILGVLGPMITLIQLLAVASLVVDAFSSMSGSVYVFFMLIVAGVLSPVFFLSMVFTMPRIALRKFLKAYPYSE